MLELRQDEIQKLLLEVMTHIDAHCAKVNIPYYMIGGTLLGSVRHKGFIPWDDDIDIAMFRADYERFIASWKPEEHPGYFLQNTYTDKTCCHTITRILVCGTQIVHNGSYNITKKHSEMFFDIFPLDNVPDAYYARELQRKRLRYIKRVIGYKFSNTRSSNGFKQILKNVRRTLLRLFPYHVLIELLNREATRYNNQDTENVCSMSSQYDYRKQTMNISVYGKPVRMPFEEREFLGPEKSEEYLRLLYGDYLKLPPESKRVFNIRVLADEKIKERLE